MKHSPFAEMGSFHRIERPSDFKQKTTKKTKNGCSLLPHPIKVYVPISALFAFFAVK
jgi:hypothetical protein